MRELPREKEKLKEVIRIVKDNIASEELEIETLYKTFIGSREELWRAANMRKVHLENLKKVQDRPYFARIDFVFDKTGKKESVYIGNHGVSEGNNIVVTDWRAPISSLYYDAELGRCSYASPSGIVSGSMELKRQFDIVAGELLGYYDVDLVANDDLLQKYLNTNNDTRLKSIVATIQKEQNDVIRRSIGENLIIQGVAGSGKTTVALHRIAYLVYNYMKNYRQNQFLVLGPNPVFLKYIKSVLPDLDVTGVTQSTFEAFAQEYIDEELTINSSDKKVNASIAGKMTTDVDKFKSSMRFKSMIDEFLKFYFYSLTANDFRIDGFTIMDSKTIMEVFASFDNSTVTSLENKVELTIEKLSRMIEDNQDDLISRYDTYMAPNFRGITKEEREKLLKQFVKNKDEIKKGCRTGLKKYFAKAKVTPTKLYKLFISSIENYDLYNYEFLSTLKKDALENIKKGTYDFEDLAALMHIKAAISPVKETTRIQHVVVDEAQDLGEFNFAVLREVMPNTTFSIFGDLAQSIYDYRGISCWEDVNEIMFGGKGKIIKFNKSYRTTAEIMDVANGVASSMGMDTSDMVVRHGAPVDFDGFDNATDIPIHIALKIEEYKAKGYKTIAVISKTHLLSCYINDDLTMEHIIVPNVSIDDDLTDPKFQVCTISNQLAKGLEFDAVIINDASERIYSSDSSLDMKLLYVAITRALHEVDIAYSGTLTKPLADYLNQTKDNNRIRKN